MLALGRARKFVDRVREKTRVVNTKNKVTGKAIRRGDGTFGELVPTERPLVDKKFEVARGPIATIEIGAETKILAKAMIKQIDRVCGDLQRQAALFKGLKSNVITVAFVGINQAEVYTSYEGERSFTTNGGASFRHPAQEAHEARRRLELVAAPHFDHFLILPFSATNQPPFSFYWKDENQVKREYGALLTRISIQYDELF